MGKVNDLTVDELEHLIENKLIELLGDPDSGLKLKKEFKSELEQRLKNPGKKLSHSEVSNKIA